MKRRNHSTAAVVQAAATIKTPLYGMIVVIGLMIFGLTGWATYKTPDIAVIVLGVLSILMLLFFMIIINSRVMGPLSALMTTIHRIAQGDTTARASVTNMDELGVVAAQMNKILDFQNESQQAKEEEYRLLQEGIQQLLMVVADASDGDLSVRVPVTEGALGNVADAINLMLENVGDLIREVQAAASQVAAAAVDIQSSSEALSQGAQKQTTEITTTTGAVEEMAERVESVSRNATSATQAAERARHDAEEGAKAIEEVVAGMERIRQNVLAGAKKIKRLGERSMEISTIVSTISDISAQTDMLALNAAIEAARAGEHGRGFTVVAEEVRKLAERAAGATREIEDLISGIQAETNESVTSMETQTAEVEEESAVVSSAGDTLRRIRESALQTAELINEINESAKHQVSGTKSVVERMGVVSQIAGQAQSGTDQTRRSTESLASLAQELTDGISQFKID